MDLIQGKDHLQFHHNFPQAVLKKQHLSTTKINDICNLSFISGRTDRKISNKEPSLYLPDIVTKIGIDALRNQAITNNPEIWSINAYNLFLEKRRKLVASHLNEFLSHDAIDRDASA